MQVNPGHQFRIYTIFLSPPDDLQEVRNGPRCGVQESSSRARSTFMPNWTTERFFSWHTVGMGCCEGRSDKVNGGE